MNKPLINYIEFDQLMLILELSEGEEGEFFKDKLKEIQEIVNTAPVTYGQDGKGEEAISYLHYFRNGMHYFITELDVDSEEDGEIQCYGLGYINEAERGYISLPELFQNKFEIDLHWTPKTLKQIKEERNW
jgi:hypothetical protein